MKQAKRHRHNGRESSYRREESDNALIPPPLASESCGLNESAEEQERDRKVDDHNMEATEHRSR